VTSRPGERLLDLVEVMDRLRSPGGCPWDEKQTHESLVPYLIEETYETLDAIESKDSAALLEELGDVLLQVVFHARIAQDGEQPWSIDDVADGIVTKLVSRHPHVFADGDAETPEQVESAWQAIKAREKGRTSVTDGVPMGLPALALAAKLLSRARNGHVAVDLPASDAADEVVDALPDTAAYGDLLLALVAAGAERGWEAETALRDANRRYAAALRQTEGHKE
jgi:XTP/dITP diphosphohydrolase